MGVFYVNFMLLRNTYRNRNRDETWKFGFFFVSWKKNEEFDSDLVIISFDKK